MSTPGDEPHKVDRGGPDAGASGVAGRCTWLVDGNNVFGSRPDGWWNDRGAAMQRFAQRVAEWARTHTDAVIVVFDQPVPDAVLHLGGGNLSVRAAQRKGRNAADDTIAELAHELVDADTDDHQPIVITSDRGLRGRLPSSATVRGVGYFRDLIHY